MRVCWCEGGGDACKFSPNILWCLSFESYIHTHTHTCLYKMWEQFGAYTFGETENDEIHTCIHIHILIFSLLRMPTTVSAA